MWSLGLLPVEKVKKYGIIPVFNTVKEALEAHAPIDATVVLVPGQTAKAAVIEAYEAGIKTLLMEVERVPLHDSLEVIALAKKYGVRLLGPGSAGLVSPGKASIGVFGSPEELARVAFIPGRVGVISRSGGQTTTLCWNICREGFGISTAINLGVRAGPWYDVSGTLSNFFQEDDKTDIVAYFGEIGGVMEEEAAELIKQKKYTKPLVAFIAGRGLTSGIRFSHASAIIEGGKGTAEGKGRSTCRRLEPMLWTSLMILVPTIAKLLRNEESN